MMYNLRHFCHAFFALIILSIPSTQIHAQSIDTSFRLFWYKGKKVNDTTLISKAGDRVTYSPAIGEVYVGLLDKNDRFASYKKEIKKNENRKSEVGQRILNGPGGKSQLGLVIQLNKGMDKVASQSQRILENHFTVTNMDKGMRGGEYAMQPGDGVPVLLTKYYNEVMAFLKKIKGDSLNDAPPPPSAEFDYCFVCDSDRQKAYKSEGEAFINNYLGAEKDHMMKALEVMRYFTFRKVKGLPYDARMARMMEPDMSDAIKIIRAYTERKLLHAWKTYNKDATKIPYLLELMMTYVHTNEVMGIETGSQFPGLDSIAKQAITAAQSYLKDALFKRNYPVILNIRWIVELFRMAEMLDMTNASDFEHSITEYANHNRFFVAVDADAKMGEEGTFRMATMKGENIFRAIPDSNCVLKWTILGGTDSTKMKYQLVNAAMESTERVPVYAGTEIWKTNPAKLSLDFCRVEKDTALFYGFSPVDDEEIWNIPDQGNKPTPIVSNLFMAALLDEPRMRAMAAEYQKPEAIAKLRKELEEKQQIMQKAHEEMVKNGEVTTPKGQEKLQEYILAKQNVLQHHSITIFSTYLLRGQLKNNLKTIFDHQLDGKKLMPENETIQFAWFKVKIIHVEDGDKEF